MKKNNSKYSQGKRWGYAIFHRNFTNFGETGIAMSDKASSTIHNYLQFKRKDGKKLSDEQLNFYKGAVNGL